MKNLLVFFLCAVFFTAVSAGERETLLKAFQKESAEAEKEFQSAMTTVELTGAAGGMMTVARGQFLRALEYKLRKISDRKKRLELLEDSFTLCRTVVRITSERDPDEGSGGPMSRYCKGALLFRQQRDILMLDDQAQKRWDLIADAPLEIDRKSIQLKKGRGEFTSMMYGRPTFQEILLFPADTFSFQNRHFALIRSDAPGSMNNDFSRVFLCEAKKGKLVVLKKSAFAHFSKWTLKDDLLILYSHKGSKEKIFLRKQL